MEWTRSYRNSIPSINLLKCWNRTQQIPAYWILVAKWGEMVSSIKSTSFEWLRSMAIDDYTNMPHRHSAVCAQSHTTQLALYRGRFSFNDFIELNPILNRIKFLVGNGSEAALFFWLFIQNHPIKLLARMNWTFWIRISKSRARIVELRLKLTLDFEWWISPLADDLSFVISSIQKAIIFKAMGESHHEYHWRI